MFAMTVGVTIQMRFILMDDAEATPGQSYAIVVVAIKCCELSDDCRVCPVLLGRDRQGLDPRDEHHQGTCD